MGTTSQKLSYLNDTKGKLKDSINKFRDGITDQTKFRDYATELDGIYDKLPKVSANGSNFSLENAQNGKLDSFGMDGNTEQTTYTGKNLCGIPNQTFTHNNVDVTILNGEITLNGTASSTGTKMLDPINTTILNGSYTLNKIYISGTAVKTDSTNYGNFNIRKQSDGTIIDGTQCGYNAENTNMKKTISESTSIVFGIYVTNNTTYTNYKFKPQLIVGNEEDYNFEPYVGGTPSPNPDYPQDIKVVENEQIVNVTGKNLFDKGEVVRKDNYYIDTDGSEHTSSGSGYTTNYISLQPNTTYTISGNITSSTNAWGIYCYNSSKQWIEKISISNNTPYTFTTPSNCNYIRLQYRLDIINFNTIQIEEGSTATTYEPYYTPQNYTIGLGSMELCKIDTYKDSIKKSTGKNLFDKDSVILGKVWNGASNTKRAYGYIEAIQGQVYTASTQDTSSDLNIYITETASVGTGGEHIKQTKLTSTLTFTPQSDTKYIVVQFTATTNDITQEMVNNALIQIEENNQATDYEPFGTDWYIKKEIGKVVLNGSETGWGRHNSGNYFYINKNDMMKSSGGWKIAKGYSNNYYPYSYNYIYDGTPDYGFGIGYNSSTLAIRNKDITSLNDFKTWLSTHNTTVYYVLATPTYETITNSTLISQLESIKVNTGSNYFTLSNSNNVLPTLYVSRLKELGKLS